MLALPIHQAVGRVLAHDVTRIVPGKSNGPVLEVVFATLHGNHRVEAGQTVGGTRVIPLIVPNTWWRKPKVSAAAMVLSSRSNPFSGYLTYTKKEEVE